MGLFSKNWAKELDRADDLLARDLPVSALEIAERAEAKAEPELRQRAASLAQRAREALMASLLAKVDAAEAAGDLDDAADWLLSAIEREPSAGRRDELEARRQALIDGDAGPRRRGAVLSATVTVTSDEDDSDLETAFRYETLVSMLADEIQPLYAERGEDFQQAVVELNEGRPEAARELLAPQVEANPEDPVLRLELGRARFLAGEHEAAREDFAVAWEALGDGPLDAGEAQFVAALWAEAALASDAAGEVVARLAPLAAPESGQPEVCRLYALALLASDRGGEALGYLDRVTALLPRDADLNLLMAQALSAAGERQRAIAGLEQAVAASCGAGGCAKPGAHLPSFRLLARLQLEQGNPERARELVAHLASAQHGTLAAEDHAILAAYYHAVGDLESAAESTAEVERSRAAGGASQEAVAADLGPSQRRVL